MSRQRRIVLAAGVLFILLGGVLATALVLQRDPYGQGDASRVRVVFTGGYETDPVDHGRPVKLIAAAIGVPTETFRQAFSAVRPAQGMMGPSPERARENKAALMKVLSPLGVTNERLDEVSNYYRYRPGDGRLWQHEPAVAFAIVENGQVVRFEIVKSGSGYMNPPRVSVPGHDNLSATVDLGFGQDFASNGAIHAINVAPLNPAP